MRTAWDAASGNRCRPLARFPSRDERAGGSMAPPWSLTLALASLESEIWATSRFGGFGLIEPHADGRVRFEIRTRAATAASFLEADDMRAAATTDRVLTMWQLGPMARTPIGVHGAEFFAAASGDSLRPDELESVSTLARKIGDVYAGGEPAAAREQRLTKIEALDDLPRALAGTLEIRDVFGHLSQAARRVVPHDSAIVFVVSDDRRRAKLYALTLPDGVTYPDEIDAK